MRKYGLDEAQVHTEQNTLLEPNNFIPSWVQPIIFIRLGNRRRGKEGGVQRAKEAATEV